MAFFGQDSGNRAAHPHHKFPGVKCPPPPLPPPPPATPPAGYDNHRDMHYTADWVGCGLRGRGCAPRSSNLSVSTAYRNPDLSH